MTTIPRRRFLRLAAATAAAAVAGLRLRPEPTGMTHELMTHELLSSAHPDITQMDDGWAGLSTSGDCALFYGESPLTCTQLVPSDLLDDTQFDLQAYIEAEIRAEMRAIALEIDREFMEGAGTGAVLGVLKV